MRRMVVGPVLIGCGATLASAQNLSITPLEGRAGSRIYFMVQDQQAQWKFNDSTRIGFTGEFTSEGFVTKSYPVSVQFSEAEVLLNGDWEARIVIGTGTSPQLGDAFVFTTPGGFDGTFQIITQPTCRADVVVNRAVDFADMNFVLTNYGMMSHPADISGNGVVDFPDMTIVLTDWGPCAPDVTITKTAVFRLTEGGERWTSILDEDGFQGPAIPIHGPAFPSDKNLPILWVSILPEPTTPQAMSLEIAHWAHMALVYVIEENADSLALAPQSFTVDIVNGIPFVFTLDRLDDVVLTRLANDGDPTSIVFSTPLSKPIIFTDLNLNNASYPQFDLLMLRPFDRVFVAPADVLP
ncbi:MAG: hypothetical protein JNK58_04615 [Phycisphaerae bacterium]|nr:hypothetical protein [Phycisphaerae bacterium]